MKLRSGLVMGAVLAATSSFAYAQTPATPGTPAALADTAARVRERALSGSGAYDILESLTTETGPRPAGSPAFARAKDWARRQAHVPGLQERPRRNLHQSSAGTRAPRRREVTAPFPQPLVITGLGRSVATPPEGIEAEVAIFRTFEELQAAPPNSLTGKIAVLTEKMGGQRQRHRYGTANRWRRKGASEAGKRGAVGFLIRSLATNLDRSPHSGALNYDDDAPKIPAAASPAPTPTRSSASPSAASRSASTSSAADSRPPPPRPGTWSAKSPAP